MKHRRLFGFALFFPYLLWVVSILVTNLAAPQEASDIWNYLLLPVMYYAVGVIFWFIPYTLLAIGMWIWSKNKSATSLRKIGVLAPIIFTILVIIEISILLSSNTGTTGWDELIGFFALLITCSLFFGYLFVGITLVIFKVFQSQNLITEEATPSP